MTKITQEELNAALKLHELWLSGKEGERGLDLSWQDLSGLNLSRANLAEAILTGTNLTEANLTGANLSWANLSEANLTRANLTVADLTEATLAEANLSGAILTGAILTEADLTGANLSEANLTRANLTGADLTKTSLIYLGCFSPFLIILTPTHVHLGCKRAEHQELLRLEEPHDALIPKEWWGAWLKAKPLIETAVNILKGDKT